MPAPPTRAEDGRVRALRALRRLLRGPGRGPLFMLILPMTGGVAVAGVLRSGLHSGHTFMTVAGLRFDTSGQGSAGTRWQRGKRSTAGLTVRHPPGL